VAPWRAQWALPKALAALNPRFSLPRTKFNNDKDKSGTGRRVAANALGRGHAFTLEVSFYGYTLPEHASVLPFTQADYLQLGMDLGRAVGRAYP
jgi:hypothetical protein